MRLAVFTICSNNYVPHARLLLDTVQQHLPGADRFLILADERHDFVVYPEGCEVISGSELDIPDFRNFVFRYDVMELNTAIKPFAFQRLLQDCGYTHCLYFDPDIELFGAIPTVINALADGASFVLTPHLLSPAEQEESPNDITIMQAGIYNLGFVGVSAAPEALKVLAWWARRLRWQCVNDQPNGIFVDQRFMDLVPGFAPGARVLHDPGLNVAYWNLAQRRFIPNAPEGPLVDGQPLGFFHYSGFDPRDSGRISKHTELFRDGRMPGPLVDFLAGYAERLIAAGHGKIPAGTYSYGRFASGVPIPTVARRMFRENHAAWAGDPFNSYEAWMHLPAPGAVAGLGSAVPSMIMRYVQSHYSWLQHAFNIADSSGAEGYTRWWVRHGLDIGLDRRLLEPQAVAAGLRPVSSTATFLAPDPSRADATVIGYLRAESGVGEVGRLQLASLSRVVGRAEGLDVQLGVASRRDDRSVEANLLRDDQSGTGRLVVFSINADQLPHVVETTRARLPRHAYRACIPFWELSRFPTPYLEALHHVDEIWAPTRFIQAGLAASINLPVVHIPVALSFPTLTSPRHIAPIPPGRPYVLFAFDFLSFAERKNPLAAVRAFRAAFGNLPAADRPALIIKSQNSAHLGGNQALRDAIAEDEDVVLFDCTLNRLDTLTLVAGAACVLSLHRGEGLGLLVAEAMAYGVPVVATDYGGSTDLLTPETGFPVDCRLIPVPKDAYPFWEGQVWADADVDHAAWSLHEVFERPDEAARRVDNARQWLEASHGAAAVAARQAARLEAIGLI
ncbi:Glycosyltransferase involved in cell wall bisynthesis [Rhizobiales bacterium GAS191]|nr:Glycosyltransferase involved in cell wall bisynthesis [Rhizobiales bacterium GAS113]SED04568.1 Glycosyltransferase involved in cell wall bisynthesis [Rhizobiales bacterium GAS191]